MKTAIIAALAVLACACGRPSQEAPVKSNAPAVWSAFRGGREVLRFREGPGPLVSTALPSPGTPPVQHAFLTATALDPATEGELREILEASRSFADFSERLKKAGYDVRRTDSQL